MRRALIFAGLVAGLIAPSTAAAQAQPICPLADGPYEYQAGLSLYAGTWWTGQEAHNPAGGVTGAAKRALGAQYTGFWFDTARQGLSVAFAPGPLDATTARAAIVRELAADFTPDQIAFVEPKLNLLQDEFSEAELNAAWQQVGATIVASGLDMTSSVGCFGSGAWRVIVTRGLVPEATPEIRAETEALFASLGDKVFIEYQPGTTVVTALAAPAPTTPAPVAQSPFVNLPAVRVRDFVSRPATGRCLRGALTVTAKRGVTSVRVTAGKRHATATAGRKARLALKQRSTHVTVTVTLPDGRSASQKLIYKRCA
ncbi:hypothetical protein OM076_28045 [Solirubrobacter ginsenosidimutans]|uniref:Uncharacterized protein n=1 Tax=Solirubrobacter ginsenosidimutans TaxID=490573 RepID=A0A9X3S876_9ACTN|nr:hypothetical protein [Solirubrobacter ginsenosidimutans]MDA0164158.1 hypothetical protein [Solirubrobacter ginsenosidimutans]